MAWTDLFSDPDFYAGLFEAGASLSGGLLENETNQDTLALSEARLAQDRELTLAQIAASRENAGLAAAASKEIAAKNRAAQLAAQYGNLASKSSLAGAEALKDKDVQIPTSIANLFSRIQSPLG